MSVCQSCNGIIGRDCWNPQECAEITARIAMETVPTPAPASAVDGAVERAEASVDEAVRWVRAFAASPLCTIKEAEKLHALLTDHARLTAEVAALKEERRADGEERSAIAAWASNGLTADQIAEDKAAFASIRSPE